MSLEEVGQPIDFSRPWRLGMTRAPLGRISAAQFFVTAGSQPAFTMRHPCFGTVISGKETVFRITSVPTYNNGRPIEPVVLVLSTYAPHIGEELWRRLGHEESLAYAAWPDWDEAALRQATMRIAVQVQGKLRGLVEVGEDAPEDEILALAKVEGAVARHLEGKQIVKEIYVPCRLVNLVVKPA